ncbi:VanZ family protein [Pueribacillus sp. YX66]|uniref:VanZ family protein n=1 Tax=Pueribacillus sp. YX66 TaxID=3229242 RepID=UPI00358D3FCE
MFARLVNTLIPNAMVTPDLFNFYVRKAAHFFAYFVLGMLALHAFIKSGLHGWRSIWCALALCVLYAITDEVHQLFIAGRAGQVRDVLIDSVGAIVGISLFYVVIIRENFTLRK